MALKIAERVQETSTTTGIGTLNLDGPTNGHQSFVAGVGGGNTVPYAIEHGTSGEWEVGEGAVTTGIPDTLSRVTVFESSNSDNKVNFSSGTLYVSIPQSAFYARDASFLNKNAVPDAQISQSSVTQHEGAIDHDLLTNFVANEHIDHSGVSISSGTGLSGGGDITASRTLSVDNYANLARLDQAETVTGAWAFNADVTISSNLQLPGGSDSLQELAMLRSDLRAAGFHWDTNPYVAVDVRSADGSTVLMDVSAGQQPAMTAQDGATVDATYGSQEQGVIQNNRTRIQEIEDALETLGLITTN